MKTGLLHKNHAIKTLQIERQSLNEAMKGWSDKEKAEYHESWKDRDRKLKELDNAIEFLKER